MIIILHILIVGLFFYPVALSALSESEESVLSMYFNKNEMAVTPTRYLKPVSQSAENIVVITAEEIKTLNAKTVQEVIKYVTGTFVIVRAGGGGGIPRIQGSEPQHTKVLIDGVPINSLSLDMIPLNTISVGNIERIEIIKGPASSVWGSSLGGVINIITKDAGGTKPADVSVTASYGNYNTMDDRIEARGTINKFSYYASAVREASQGYSKNLPVNMEWFYTKLKYDVTNDLQLGAIGSYFKDRGEPILPNTDSDSHRSYFVLNADYRINDETSVSTSFRTMEYKTDAITITDNSTADTAALDKDTGGSVIIRWAKSNHSLVAGSDYDLFHLSSNLLAGAGKSYTKYAVFANDTILLDKFAVTPGLRYDYFNISGSFVSPSLGVTYEAGKDTILRLMMARGFNTPYANFTSVNVTSGDKTFLPNYNLKVEKVMSYQLGIETALLKYLWLKTSVFRHDIKDAINLVTVQTNVVQAQNKQKVQRQGFEAELSTIPIYNTIFSSGFSFIDARDKNAGELVSDTPRYSIDTGVEYNDRHSFKASLKGHYIRWHIIPSDYNNSYTFIGNNSFIWDINMTKQVYQDKYIKTELFLKGTNLLNDSLFNYANRNYGGRLMEIGMRAEF